MRNPKTARLLVVIVNVETARRLEQILDEQYERELK